MKPIKPLEKLEPRIFNKYSTYRELLDKMCDALNFKNWMENPGDIVVDKFMSFGDFLYDLEDSNLSKDDLKFFIGNL